MDRNNRQRAFKARAEDRKHEEERDRRRTKRHDPLNARRNRVPKTPPKRHIATRSTKTQDEEKEKSMRERLAALAEFKKKRQEGTGKAKKKPFLLVSKTNTIPERLEPLKKIGFTSATVDSRRQKRPAMPALVPVRKFAPKSLSQSTRSKKATAPVQKQIKTASTETKKLTTPKTSPLPSTASPVKELETVTETETETEDESPTTKLAGVNHFEQIVCKKADQTDVACVMSDYLETDIPEQGCEMIRAAVGKAQLPRKKSTFFFEKLFNDAENVDIEEKTPCPIRRSTRLHSRLLSPKKKMLAMKDEASSGDVVNFAQKAHTDDSTVAPMPVENDLKTPPPWSTLSSDDDDEGRTPPPLKWPSSAKSKSKRRSQGQLIIRQKLLENTSFSFERARLSLQSSTSNKRLSRSQKKSSTAKQRVLFDENERTMDATSPIEEDQPAVLPQSYLMPTSSGTGGNIVPDSLEEEEENEIGSLVTSWTFKFCSDNCRRTRRSNLMFFTPRHHEGYF